MKIQQLNLSTLALLFSIFVHGQTHSISGLPNKENIPVNIRQEHRWWNLLHYNIAITPDYKRKYIRGTNSITFSAQQTGKTMEIDLQEPMRITRITWENKNLVVKKSEKNTYHITFPSAIKAGEIETFVINFEGEPKEAVKPPFDSGWIWAKDEKGRPWISVACEGSGASIWLPCKEVLYDEPDNGVSFSITIPDTLTAIANGRLKNKSNSKKGTVTYTWTVVSPINNYNIIPSIGKYVNWHNDYTGIKGKLDCDFWVLDYNLDKGKKHLKQTDTMLLAFEYWLGPYPFYEDSYKLVEAPMPGMEHQSAVAYGNGFQNGYRGKDFISGSGWGLKWDFMLIHESGHEWFGNSITCSGDGDSWIHEGFTKYLETLYTSYVFGPEAGNDYAIGTWKRIKNDEPILGTNTSDKYYKGSAMLHMIRQIIGDTMFRKVLTGLNSKFYHQTVSTSQVLELINSCTKKNFTYMFDQYLKTIQVPCLDYSLQGNVFRYRWSNCIENFAMPIRISLDGENYQFIFPTTQWQDLNAQVNDPKSFRIDRNFYINRNENK
jgi:aminopeptidase N